MTDDVFDTDVLYDAIRAEDLTALQHCLSLFETDSDQFSVLEACMGHGFLEGIHHCANVLAHKYPQGSEQWVETMGSLLPELCVHHEEAFHKFFPSSNVLSSGCMDEILNAAMYHGRFAIVQSVLAIAPNALSSYSVDLASGQGHLDIMQWVLNNHKDKVKWTAGVPAADFFGHDAIVQLLFDHASSSEREEVSNHLRHQKRTVKTSQWLRLHRADLEQKALTDAVQLTDAVHTQAPPAPRSKM